MKKGIIFDLDGTLWDSTIEVAKSWNVVVKRKGYRELTEEDMARVMGLPMNKLARALFPELEPQESYDLMDECVIEENAYLTKHGATLYPKLEETLQELKKDYFLYIVSNCQCGYIESFLNHYDFWKYFEDIQCYGQNQLPKGDNIRLLADRNELEWAVYVGDIQGDYDASMAAGVEFIHAKYGFGTVRDGEKEIAYVNSFEELPQIVQNKQYYQKQHQTKKNQ